MIQIQHTSFLKKFGGLHYVLYKIYVPQIKLSKSTHRLYCYSFLLVIRNHHPNPPSASVWWWENATGVLGLIGTVTANLFTSVYAAAYD